MVISIQEELVDYIGQSRKQNELGNDAMKIDFIGTLSNYLADTMANSVNKSLQIE